MQLDSQDKAVGDETQKAEGGENREEHTDSKTMDFCPDRGFNKNGLHRFIYLNIWCAAGGIFGKE